MEKKRFEAPVAVHLFLIKENKILLLRRFNTGFEDGKYSVVAGHLDGGETVKEATIREAKEEANIHLTEDQIEVVGVMHRMSDEERIDFFLVAFEWSGTIQNNEPHKCDELSFYSIDNLPKNTIPYIREALKNNTKQIFFKSFGWKKS